jgi:Tyrosine phosphatase family
MNLESMIITPIAPQALPASPAPLRVLCSAAFEDLWGGSQPSDPAREGDMLFEAVGRVCTELTAGRGVVVHCQGGTGRTGTVIACTLRAMGVSNEIILKYMDSVNRSRCKYPGWRGWPESTWQKQQVERFDRRQDV